MYSTAEPSSCRFDELALSMYTYYDEDPFHESLYLIDIDDEGTKGRSMCFRCTGALMLIEALLDLIFQCCLSLSHCDTKKKHQLMSWTY